MMKRVGALMCAAAALALAAGCLSYSPTVIEKEGAQYDVRVGSLLLNNHIRVTERSVDRNVNDLLVAQVRGQNVSNRDVQFEYRFLWKDAAGRLMSSGTSVWTPLRLTARQIGFMQATATSPAATDFLMELRFVRDASNWEGVR